MSNTPNTKEKFWRLTKLNVITGCIEWTGTLWSTGYARFHFRNKDARGHRLAWLWAGHEIPEDLCVLHRCDNRKCVNHEHLFVGNRADNHRDAVRKNRNAKGEKVYTAKITAADVMAIRADTGTSDEIARKFRLTWGHINKIKGKRCWAHV